MKTKSVLISTLVAASAALTTMVAIADGDSDMDRSHPKAYVKDSAITTKVKAKLAADHVTSLAQIRVDTDDDGVVWLRGSTQTREAADRAIAIARATENVKDVHSVIVVKHNE